MAKYLVYQENLQENNVEEKKDFRKKVHVFLLNIVKLLKVEVLKKNIHLF